MSLKGTNLTSTDAALLSAWLSIPTALRVLLAVGAFLSMGWTARGVVGEAAGMSQRMDAYEDTTRVFRRQLDSVTIRQENDRRRFEHALMYQICLQANEGSPICNEIVREYPEFIRAKNAEHQP